MGCNYCLIRVKGDGAIAPFLSIMHQMQQSITELKPVKVFKGGFVKIEEIGTNAATPSSVSYENIKKNIVLGLPKIENLSGYQKIKGHNNPIALVGGGPSLSKCINELEDFDTILVCGSPHDYLANLGFVPTYAAICDPDPISINYYQKLNTKTKYLLSTSIDSKLLEHFKNHQRILWHCHSPDYDVKEIEHLEGVEYHGISGGCTVGLRAINIALMFGYTNLHFFGFDSCLSEDECHAYSVSQEERTNFGKLHTIKLRDITKIDGPGDKIYICMGYQLAQANAFKDFYLSFGKLFTPTFHGEGLLSDYWKLIVDILGEDVSIQ